jgi:Xaa-Pro aminopeptidase
MAGLADIVERCDAAGLDGGVLGIEFDVVPVQIYHRLEEVFGRCCRDKGGAWSFVDIAPLVLAQRGVKDEREIALARRAAEITDLGHRTFANVFTAGATELSLAAEVEATMRRSGHEGFQPRQAEAHGAGVLLASGEHLTIRGGHGLVVTGAGLSAAMPYGPSHRRLQAGDTVVLDIASTYAGYTTDQARSYVVGQASPAQRALFQITLETQAAVLETLEPGTTGPELYSAAQAVIARGARPYFAPEDLVLPGFVGHGVGLEIDEPPVLWPRDDVVVQAGMMLAIEIEVSAPVLGLMAKLEDTVVVRPGGYEMLTNAPRELVGCAD